jgi:hypothetical protein
MAEISAEWILHISYMETSLNMNRVAKKTKILCAANSARRWFEWIQHAVCVSVGSIVYWFPPFSMVRRASPIHRRWKCVAYSYKWPTCASLRWALAEKKCYYTCKLTNHLLAFNIIAFCSIPVGRLCKPEPFLATQKVCPGQQRDFKCEEPQSEARIICFQYHCLRAALSKLKDYVSLNLCCILSSQPKSSSRSATRFQMQNLISARYCLVYVSSVQC